MSFPNTWKNWILTLPEDVFFRLARNYLGKLPTPFNKHHIFEGLSGFLSQPRVQNALAASLDALDHRILTIISLLDEPSEASVLDTLTDQWSPWDLRQRLANLQERLILYKDNGNIYHLTPPLEEKFRTQVIRTEKLFPSSHREGEGQKPPWLWDGLLLAFRSYLFHSPSPLKADGTMTKKGREDWENRFPHFAQNPEEGDLFLKATAAEGLWEKGSEGWTLIEGPWERLKPLSMKDRSLRLWGRALLTRIPSSQWKLKDGIFLIASLWNSLHPRRTYPAESLTRIFQVILSEGHLPRTQMIPPLNILTALGLLIEERPGQFCLNRQMLPLPAPEAGAVLQPNYELTLPPVPNFAAALSPLGAFKLLRYDRVGQYLLTQESYGRNHRRGGKKLPFTALLEAWIGRPPPQNIAFSLTHWDNQLQSVRLLEGLILKVSQERIPLLEKNPLFSPYIQEILAPGIYLLDPEERDAWEAALLKTGITALPPLEQSRKTAREEEVPKPVSPLPGGITLPIHTAKSLVNYSPPNRKSLFARLKELKLPEEEAKELANRIERGVILFPEQLIRGIVSKEVRTATGLNYQAKVQLIRDTLSAGQAYLEVSWFSREDGLITQEIIPHSILKEEADLYLTGAPLSDPGKKDFRIQIRKISRVKRRKLSFFG